MSQEYGVTFLQTVTMLDFYPIFLGHEIKISLDITENILISASKTKQQSTSVSIIKLCQNDAV